MKNKLLQLLKINLLETYKLKAISKKKWLLIAIIVIYVIVGLFTTLSMLMSKILDMFTSVGMTSYYITVLFLIASLFSFAFGIFSAKSGLFDNKDNDLVLSLPVKKRDILTSRLLMIAIYNFVLGLVFIIPGIYIYLKEVPATAMYNLSLILLCLFFTIIPTILSCLFGYLTAFLTSKTKRKSLFELLFYTLFIGLYFLIMAKGSNFLELFVNNPDLLNKILKYLFLPIYLINKGLITNNLLYILGFIIVNVVVLLIFIFALDKKYFKIIFNLEAHQTKGNYRLTKISSKTVTRALLEKEIKRYFSSAIYVFNTIFGVIFILIGAVLSFIYSPEKLISLVNLETDLSPFLLVLVLLMFVISLSVTTNSSISIERENFWIMKMIPVKTKDIFKAKCNLNRLLVIPLTIISLGLFFLSDFINYKELVLLSILTIIYTCAISNFGLIANLLLPNLSAKSDTIIVKQSMASLVGIMGGIVFFIISFAIIYLLDLSNLYTITLLIGLSLLFLVITKIILNTWGIKKFNQI